MWHRHPVRDRLLKRSDCRAGGDGRSSGTVRKEESESGLKVGRREEGGVVSRPRRVECSWQRI